MIVEDLDLLSRLTVIPDVAFDGHARLAGFDRADVVLVARIICNRRA